MYFWTTYTWRVGGIIAANDWLTKMLLTDRFSFLLLHESICSYSKMFRNIPWPTLITSGPGSAMIRAILSWSCQEFISWIPQTPSQSVRTWISLFGNLMVWMFQSISDFPTTMSKQKIIQNMWPIIIHMTFLKRFHRYISNAATVFIFSFLNWNLPLNVLFVLRCWRWRSLCRSNYEVYLESKHFTIKPLEELVT